MDQRTFEKTQSIYNKKKRANDVQDMKFSITYDEKMNEVLAKELAKKSKSQLDGKDMLYKQDEQVINSEN